MFNVLPIPLPLVLVPLCVAKVVAHGADFPRQTLPDLQSILSLNSGDNARTNHLHG